MDVLIFDDDPYTAELLSEVLTEAGFSVEKFVGGRDAVAMVHKLKPRLVLLDIMMPGLDGLTICKSIAGDPRTAGVKVVICSGRSFARDQEEAKLCGATAFLPKPVDIVKMRKTLLELLGTVRDHPAPAPPKPTVFTARVWGSRGPAEQGTATHPTSCVVMELPERWLILDAGSGLADLCAKGAIPGKDVWLLLSHYHADHVSGLAALRKVLGPGHTLNVCGPLDPGNTLQRIVQGSLAADGAAPFKTQLFGLSESRFNPWQDVAVAALYSRHPGNTLAFRVQFGGKSLVYCPDNELEHGDGVRTDFSDKLSRFVRDADLLIHDARFSDEDYAARAGEGHGSPEIAMSLALREGVRRLALFHMDARYTDEQLRNMAIQAKTKAEARFASLAVEMALPGSAIPVA